MKNISLTQVTLFVAAVCLVSSFVNADDAITASVEEHEMATNLSIETAHIASSSFEEETIQEVEEPSDRFTFTSLDSDQNGKLSQKEVVAGKNEWLVEAFKLIDRNADQSLTEQELVNFATDMASTITETE